MLTVVSIYFFRLSIVIHRFSRFSLLKLYFFATLRRAYDC